nr:MAG TPA: L SHAPED TAIL FIBER PROTEIN [Caudoviricetes sp.]
MIYKQITLNPWEPPLGEIRVIQEEADGRDLIINLIDDNGSPLDLTGKTVSVYIQKPDNTMIYNSCEVEGNQATVTLTLQMMAVSGLTKLCELQIVDTDNHTLKVTLPPLRIVKSSSVGAVESTDEFSRLAEALNEANNATGIASEAADKANEAAQSANTAAQAANTAAQSANTAADAAASAAESANSQAQAAQTQAAYAKTQGDYAKTQGENAEEIYNQLKDIDVASLQADLDALEASKGQPNGLAALNSSGKLAQMPSASDVGALPITGGEMQGALKLKANQYGGSGPADEKYALDCQNSNIVNVNRILTADPAGSASEGWGFQREDDPEAYDVIWASNGTLYFTPGFKYNTSPYPANQRVLATTDNIALTNYLRQEYNKLKESEGTPTLNDIINGFGFCYNDSSDGADLNGVYLTVSGMTDNKYRLQLLGQYNGSNWLAYRTRNGDEQSWNPWHKVLTDNINATISAQHGYSSSKLPQIYGNGSVLQLSWANNSSVGVVLGSGAFRDAGDGNINLGASNHRFATVFAKTGSINTSDRNEKNTIADIDPEQAEKLIMGLKPSTFKFNDGTSGRTHWGIISQDIEELLPQIGMTDMDFAGFIKSPKTEDYYEDVSETVTDEETGEEKTVTRKELKTRVIEGEYVYALRYSEFIAPLICMVQKQQKQIENLERRLSALENKEEAK